MNINKISLKTMCAVLAGTTFLSSLLSVNATGAIISERPMDEDVNDGEDWTIDESNLEQIEVTYKQSSKYFVTIPKTIELNAEKQAAYSVKVAGDIDSSQRVYVAPVDAIEDTKDLDFYMKDQTSDSRKADVKATVEQSKFYWNSEEVTNGYEETNNSVSAPDLTAGTWKGTFQMMINLETNSSHIHNYVDGICDGCGDIDPNHTHNYEDGTCTICGEKDPNAGHEHNYVDGICGGCGAIDPNHTHNYEDGTCTICGKEADLYEIAPINAYINWDYTLNDEDNVITLNYYKGSETDVIVYANYVINGKTYKTKIASNGDNATAYNSYMFNGYAWKNCQNIKSIKFSDNIDTSNVTNMSYMFRNCQSLTSLDLGNFNTSNVTNMKDMFYYCYCLPSVDVSSFDTSKVTDMSFMFYECHLLTSLDLSNFDTGNVTNMCWMFTYDEKLTSVDVSSFDTSKVTDMSVMFRGCKSLTSLDLSSFDTGNVTSMATMFMDCLVLTSVDVRNFNTSKVTDMSGMFRDCYALTSVDVSSFDTSNVIYMNFMFSGCYVLTSLDLSSFNTSKVTKMDSMFQSNKNLTTIYVSRDKWTTAKATTGLMFNGCGASSVTYK